MKKLIAISVVLVLVAAVFAGCGSKNTTGPAAEPSAAPGGVKTGLAIINSIQKSQDAAAGAEGFEQADSLIVAVTVDGKGVIADCVIDMAQSKVGFDNAGKLTTPLDTEYRTKNELGADYGLGKVSSIGKDWDEQAASFAAYVVGKTVDEVKGIAVTQDGHAAGSDLTASVTIHVTDFIAGVTKAVANAAELGAAEGDKVSVATVTNIANSKDASADAEGLAQVYSTYAAITRDASGRITSCIFDGSQSNVKFDAKGTITTDLSVAPQTKNELKEAYGLKKASKIGKEWYEQAAAFAAYVSGKTLEEVRGIAVTQDGHAGASDITASVSIHVTDLIKLIEKAAA